MSRLADLLADAVAGDFPPADGDVEVVPPDAPFGLEAIVEFTGHAVVATQRRADDVLAREPDGFGGAIHPDFQRWLAGPDGWIGCHDAVLFARGRGTGALEERPDLIDHPRVRHARALREGVSVYGDERGLVTLGRGLAGRREMSVELLDRTGGGRGAGRSLIGDALAVAPADEPVFASVSPGNAASFRAFLAAGFTVIGAEIILRPG